VGKAVKKILFFWDFVVRYVRFWLKKFHHEGTKNIATDFGLYCVCRISYVVRGGRWSAFVKPVKSLFFLERIATKKYEKVPKYTKKDKKMAKKCFIWPFEFGLTGSVGLGFRKQGIY
jgi:hypothetical protein